jgi:biofilm PGA synthesis protein PgaA
MHCSAVARLAFSTIDEGDPGPEGRPGRAMSRVRSATTNGRQVPLLALAGLCLALGAGDLHAAAPSPAERQAQAVADARAGRFDTAITALEALHRAFPADRAYLHDLIEVLGWAGGRDRRILELYESVDPGSSPVPVLEAAGTAARNEHELALAEQIYRKVLGRDRARRSARIGLASVLAEAGKRSNALAEVDYLDRQHPNDPEIWFTRGYVHEATGSPVEALAQYLRVLAAQPAHREADRRRVLVISKMGAPHLASELIARHPDRFTDDERFAVDADREAIQTRWGGVTPISREPRHRFDDTDRALAYQDRLLAKPWAALDLARAEDRRLAFDRMVALRDRLRMTEVVGLHEQLLAAGVEPPVYALIAAGDAYVYLERPTLAVDVYHKALEREPKNYNARLALFYAYTDLDDFRRAYALIDELAAEQPVWLRHPRSRTDHRNPVRLEADVAAALARSYADELSEAQQRLDGMVALAPASFELRQELASVHLRRGWPRQALHEYQLLRGEDPHSRSARIGEAGALFARHRYPETEQSLRSLQTDYPEDKQVQRLARSWDLYQRNELIVDSRIGHVWNSEGGGFGQLGGDSIEVDSFLFSRPKGYFTRAYLHQHFSTADFTEGTGTDHRLSVGAEHRQPDYLLAGEVGGGFVDNSGLAATLRGTWEIDDHWALSGLAELNSVQVPLRGLRAGVDGNFVGVAAEYRWHESQAVRAGTGYLDFDDGNERNMFNAVFERRVIEVPHFHTTAFIEGYASMNDRNDVIYYSPTRDASLGLTLDNEWVTYRRYERRFAQRLGLSIGRYWEEGYAPDFTWGISYQHDWDFTEGCRLHYGVVHGRRVFDGEPEFETAVVVGLDVRF